VAALLPHAKRDAKLSVKSDRPSLLEVAELHNCTSCLYWEARKRQDLYLWCALARPCGGGGGGGGDDDDADVGGAGAAQLGPTAKFLVTNIHTMEELRLPGNHLLGSRPVLSFDAAFDATSHGRLIKEMLSTVFAVPRGHRRSKPFFDHVTHFGLVDGRVWVRNYQVLEAEERGKIREAAAAAAGDGSRVAELPAGAADLDLAECGPRFVLQPVKIFAGAFGGRTLYENPFYVSPNEVRRALKRRRGDDGRYSGKVGAAERRRRDADERGDVADPFEGNALFRPSADGVGSGGGGGGSDQEGESPSE